MKATIEQIRAKIPDLPTGVTDLVHRASIGSAEVESFSGNEDGPYKVHIRPHEEDPGDKSLLDVVCSCPARTLCKHVVAYYAVAKGLVPKAAPKPLPPDRAPSSQRREEGLQLIAKGQQQVSEGLQSIVDGVAIIARCEARGE